MNKFEIVLIFNPELPNNSLNSEIEKIKSNLISKSANIVNEENWGLRDLSYTINKFKKAFYRYMQIEAPVEILQKMNNDLNQSEILLRYLFIIVKNHQELPTKLNYEKK